MSTKVSTMNISLPPQLREELERKLKGQGYSTASEYVRELIRQDLKREAMPQVDQLLLEGLHSGPARPVSAGDWQALHRLAERKPPRYHASSKKNPRPASRSRA